MHLYYIFFFKGIRPFYQNGRLPDDTQGSFLALPTELVVDAWQCLLLAAVHHCVWLFVRIHVSGVSLASDFFSWHSSKKKSRACPATEGNPKP